MMSESAMLLTPLAFALALAQGGIEYRNPDLDLAGVIVNKLPAVSAEADRRLDELAEADRQKNEFLAMLAHELRNPLAPMRNALYLLKMPGGDAAAALNAVNKAEELDPSTDLVGEKRSLHALQQHVEDMESSYAKGDYRRVSTCKP